MVLRFFELDACIQATCLRTILGELVFKQEVQIAEVSSTSSRTYSRRAAGDLYRGEFGLQRLPNFKPER